MREHPESADKREIKDFTKSWQVGTSFIRKPLSEIVGKRLFNYRDNIKIKGG
jgi:hypothetical protein